MLTLYDYYRSSAAYRVRITLNLKNIPHQLKTVHLVNNGGEQFYADYQALNPGARVPTLVDGDYVLTQSLAIINYLDLKYPDPPVLPEAPQQCLQIKAFALQIACDIHPLNNLSVLKYLTQTLRCDDVQKNTWYHHWIKQGFNAVEKTLEKTAGQYCFADSITLADICLIPQVYNAKRFRVDLSGYPLIDKIYQHCLQHSAFIKADPEHQPQGQANGQLSKRLS